MLASTTTTLVKAVMLTTVAFCVMSQNSLLANDDQAILTRIYSDWEHRQKVTKAFKYVFPGETTIPKGKWTGEPELSPDVKGEVPPQDTVVKDMKALLIDFESNMFRDELRTTLFSLTSGKYDHPYSHITVFDGKTARSYRPRAENSNASYKPSEGQPDLWEGADLKDSTFRIDELPIFLGHGITPEGLPPAGQPRVPLKVGRFQIQGRGAIEHRECVILRAPPDVKCRKIDEVWVDLERKSAIVRFIRYRALNDVETQLDIQYRKYDDEWWPNSWVYASYRNRKLQSSMRHQVTEFAFNPNFEKKLFQIDLQPGMVYCTDLNHNKVYKVGDDGKSLTKIVFASDKPSAPGQSNWEWVWWTALVVGGLVLVEVARRVYRWLRPNA
jgi:hypothetical protein